MIYRASFDPTTGAIGQVCGAQFSADLDEMLPAGPHTVELADPAMAGTHRVEAGELVLIETPIESLRVRAIRRIEVIAECARNRWITPSVAASGIYLAKESEARDWLAAGEPEDLADHPLIAGEIGLTAPTAWHIVQLWLGMAAAWRGIAAAIEAARLGTKAAVEAATTGAEIDAALDALETALAA